MENEVPDIFNAPLVSSVVDALWDGTQTSELRSCKTLVISVPFAPASEEEQQLLRMLGACKLGPEDYQIVQIAPGNFVAWHQLKARSGADKVLLLGVPPVQLGVQALMTLHEINHFNEAQWMVTSTLEEISGNPQLKQHLWVNMLKKVYFPEP